MNCLRFFIAYVMCVALPLQAPGQFIINPYVFAPVGGGPALIVDETFDNASGYDLSGWSETGSGTINENATGQGQSGEALEIISSGTQDNVTRDFTASADAYLLIKYRYNSLGGTTLLAHFQAAGGSGVRGGVNISGAGVITLQHGATTATITDAVPANTWVYIWFFYTNTGLGVAQAAWSTTTTRPTSGSKWQEIPDGAATSTVGRLVIGNGTSNETHTEYFDAVKLSVVGFPVP